MRHAPQTMAKLQSLWNKHRDEQGSIEQIRVKGVSYFSRWYWCVTFKATQTGRVFLVLGGNYDQARHSIIHKTNMGRGVYDEKTTPISKEGSK